MTMIRRAAPARGGAGGVPVSECDMAMCLFFLPGSELPRRCGGRRAAPGGTATDLPGRRAERERRAGQRPDPDVPEASVGVLAISAEASAQIGLPGVGEPGQQLTVPRHGDLVADLDDPHAVRDAHPEARRPPRGEEPLTAR